MLIKVGDGAEAAKQTLQLLPSEAAEPQLRPKLRVTYTTPA
ncbi:hypothetical protein [Nonomuraea polychroma]|nr:hypothetical protein [Nonomuraea polychroma]